MLTRLTPALKSVMVQAHACAVRDEAGDIREEHLLEALLADPDGGRLLGGQAVGEDLARIRAELDDGRRTGGLTAAERSGLATIGIDLDAVVARIEDQLGPDALAHHAPRRPRRWHRPIFSADAVRVLAEAERHLAAAGGRSLGVEQLALALVSVTGIISESLSRRGATENSVRRALVTPVAGGTR